MRRRTRLFALAEALRGRRTGVTAQQLADRFGVTIRTIYRDLETLQEAGMPLRADRGRGGGYALDKSYQLPPINLTAREAALLVALGRMAIDLRLVPFVTGVESALDKVRGALGGSAQRELLRVVDQLSVVGVPALPIPAPVRAAVEQAWFEDVPLEITYRKHPTFPQSKRTVRIKSLVFDRAVTLINVVDVETGEERQYKLDRIEKAVAQGPAV